MGIFDKFKSQKIQRKKILILTEKPEVARSYSRALGCDTLEGYYENKEYVITWTYGHIFSLKEPEDYDDVYRQWRLEVLPIIPGEFEIKYRDELFRKKQFSIIKELINREDIESIYLATDPAREGQLIGRWILGAAENGKPVFRVWTSSLTEKAILESIKNARSDSYYDNLFYSAETRAKIDFLIGMNFSRAYSLKYGKGTIVIGRCLTPVLALICKRDEDIDNFKPEYYCEIYSSFSPGYVGKYLRDGLSKLENKNTALKILSDVENKEGVITGLDKVTKEQDNPLLFNLTELQRVLNRKYGYTAKESLETLQKLYEEYKILSYPRTSSSYLSDKEIPILGDVIESLNFGRFSEYVDYCMRLKKLPITKRIVDNEKISDHHAIIPICNDDLKDIYSSLYEKEKNVFDEVALRFLAAFYGKYSYESIKIETQVNEHKFISQCVDVIDLGWRAVYKDSEEYMSKLPDIKLGDRVLVEKVSILDKRTDPPKKYTDDTLLEIMMNPRKLLGEQNLKEALKGKGIGTEATRADIIETLINRGYAIRQAKSIISTPLGREIINIIDIELLKSAELTADMEYNLEKIEAGELDKNDFIKQTIKFITEGIHLIKQNDIKKTIDERTIKYIGLCPYCEKGKVIDRGKGYGCTEFNKSGCKFYLSKEISGVFIEEIQAKKLINKGRTDILEGFKGSKGLYSARIALDKANKRTKFLYK